MALRRDQRAKLLRALRSGHDLDGACAQIGLAPKVVRGDAKLMAEVSEAYHVGTSRLRAKLLEMTLSSNDARTLGQLLAQREAAQAGLPPVAGAEGSPGLEALRRELLAEVERHARAVKIPENPLELLSDEALERVERACMSPEELAAHEAADASGRSVGPTRQRRTTGDRSDSKTWGRLSGQSGSAVDGAELPTRTAPGWQGEAGVVPRGAGWRNRGD
jgi:hypothetical protein